MVKKSVLVFLLAAVLSFLPGCSSGGDNPSGQLPENEPTKEDSLALRMHEIAEASDQELLDKYVNGLEIAMLDLFMFEDPGEIPSETLVRFFLYTLNTADAEEYAQYEKRWLNAKDGLFHIPIADIKEQLDTKLEHYDLKPSAIYGYDQEENAVVLSTISGFGGAVWTKLKDRSIDGDLLVLTVDFYTGDTFSELWKTKQYTIRFYEDGYKYLSILPVNDGTTTSLAEKFISTVTGDELNAIINQIHSVLVNRDGFSSVAELTSWDLFNFFADNISSEVDSSKWYNPGDRHYHFPMAEITAFLDRYFEGYNFDPRAVSSEYDLYDPGEDAVVIPAFGTHSYDYFEVEDMRAVAGDKVEIDTVYYDWIEDPELTTVLCKRRLALRIVEDGYRYISYELISN